MSVTETDIASSLQNLSELLGMKDPAKFTVVETALSTFINFYFSENE